MEVKLPRHSLELKLPRNIDWYCGRSTAPNAYSATFPNFEKRIRAEDAIRYRIIDDQNNLKFNCTATEVMNHIGRTCKMPTEDEHAKNIKGGERNYLVSIDYVNCKNTEEALQKDTEQKGILLNALKRDLMESMAAHLFQSIESCHDLEDAQRVKEFYERAAAVLKKRADNL